MQKRKTEVLNNRLIIYTIRKRSGKCAFKNLTRVKLRGAIFTKRCSSLALWVMASRWCMHPDAQMKVIPASTIEGMNKHRLLSRWLDRAPSEHDHPGG